METITKNSIAKYFKNLEKYGFKVFNFQNYQANSKGMIGMPDLLILGKKKNELYFIEIKVGRDILSDKQKEIKNILKKITNYFIATENNFYTIFDKIMERKI